MTETKPEPVMIDPNVDVEKKGIEKQSGKPLFGQNNQYLRKREQNGQMFVLKNLQSKTFEGMTTEIGRVLCLPAEGLITKKVPYEKFVELLENYMLNTFG